VSGARASLEHEQRPCVEEIDMWTGRLYWMIRIPASQHMRLSETAETYGGYGHISVLCRILSGVGPIPYTAIGIHTLPACMDLNNSGIPRSTNNWLLVSSHIRESTLSHILPWCPRPHRLCGFQQVEPTRVSTHRLCGFQQPG
jgi:hypothetical protein